MKVIVFGDRFEDNRFAKALESTTEIYVIYCSDIEDQVVSLAGLKGVSVNYDLLSISAMRSRHMRALAILGESEGTILVSFKDKADPLLDEIYSTTLGTTVNVLDVTQL